MDTKASTAEQPKAAELYLSASPHIRAGQSVSSIMISVSLALVPALAASVYFFGTRALILTGVCIVFSLLTEWAISTFLLKRGNSLTDFSALVTGLLLAFNLPPDLPPWMAALGAVFAVGVAKWAFGGLGHNFINPALAGRAFLLASYPAAMTTWAAPRGGTTSGLSTRALSNLSEHVDGITGATPLPALTSIVDAINNDALRQEISFQILDLQSALPDLFFGRVGGCIGETSALALLIGAVFLWYKRIIGIRLPLIYIGTVFVLSWMFNGSGSLFSTEALIIPTYQILAGGLMLGALYMATDMVTSPVTPKGRAIFALGCGVLTFLIRRFGGYPEGVSYSILLMNLTVPLIDRYARPKLYGRVKKA